ncbi:hypothetical protein R1sor_022463 [Riccia sorocarpa]|uniref:Core Histone H2A/H2B/H3 domain-containing protein n=1 Tax=Riccia sorocarpa TaxID=122646 RepID=A0ABD3GMX8_9MARC
MEGQITDKKCCYAAFWYVYADGRVRTKGRRLAEGRSDQMEYSSLGSQWEDGKRLPRECGIPQKYKCYRNYIYRIMKTMDPEIKISNPAMEVMNGLVQDQIHKLAREAAALAEPSKHPFIDAREIRTAVRLMFPGDLGKHAVSLGDKAWDQCMNAEE